MALRKRLLDGMQFAVFGKSFNGDDFAALGHRRKHCAGFYRATVQQDGAGAAIRGIAADMRSSKVEMLAQQIHKQGPRLDQRLPRLSVDANAHQNFFSVRHIRAPSQLVPRALSALPPSA